MSESSVSTDPKIQLTLPVAIVISSVIIAGAIFLTNGANPATAETDGLSVRDVTAQDHIIGSPDAPVVIVEFADFQCPYCALIHSTLERIVEESNGQVAWVYRHFPLTSIHPEAEPSARAAECVAEELGNEAFWGFSKAIFADQKNLGSDLYVRVARQLGADPNTFAACVGQKRHDDRVQDDLAEALSNGGQGTPFTIVIGKDGTRVPFSGALPYAQINSIVQSVMKEQ